MIPQKVDLKASTHLEALPRLGTISDHITKTEDAIDPAGIDVLEDRFQCGKVGVNVADDGRAHRFPVRSDH